jgi:hypothetical protein
MLKYGRLVQFRRTWESAFERLMHYVCLGFTDDKSRWRWVNASTSDSCIIREPWYSRAVSRCANIDTRMLFRRHQIIPPSLVPVQIIAAFNLYDLEQQQQNSNACVGIFKKGIWKTVVRALGSFIFRKVFMACKCQKSRSKYMSEGYNRIHQVIINPLARHLELWSLSAFST